VRTVRLLQVAAEAEILRLRYLMRRHGRRAAFGVLAAIFALSVLVLLDVTGWQLLRLYVAAIYATLLLLGINLVIALVFGALAARSSVSSHEREALRIRQQAHFRRRADHSPWQPLFPSRVLFLPETASVARGDGHSGDGRERNGQLPLESGRATSSSDFPAASIPRNASDTAAPIISAAAPI
jgi:TRAP-type mannitol/chloroaromatic compound transport system permease large subunit